MVITLVLSIVTTMVLTLAGLASMVLRTTRELSASSLSMSPLMVGVLASLALSGTMVPLSRARRASRAEWARRGMGSGGGLMGSRRDAGGGMGGLGLLGFVVLVHDEGGDGRGVPGGAHLDVLAQLELAGGGGQAV